MDRIITEKRIVRQDWYETELSMTGWDSHGWFFDDDYKPLDNDWTIVEHIHSDKFGNPFLGVAEKDTDLRW
jgi:hypothetical protein